MDKDIIKYILKKYIEAYGLDLFKKSLKEIKKSQDINKIEIDNKNQNEKQNNVFFKNENIELDKLIWDQNSIKLFLKLFFCRYDVFAKYWSNDKKSGYSFSCKNEWIKNLCEKLVPNSKGCKNCKFKDYLEISENNIINHLCKNQIYGTYVSNKNSETKFLVFDFDDIADLDFIKDLFKICKINNIYAYLEISASKSGCHLWIFFDDFIANNIVRKFAILLLSLTINISKNVNFKYFDRIFPTQDFLSKQELGNLIRLPLSFSDVNKKACIFLNENFEIAKNQIDFLYQIKLNNSKYITSFLNDNFKNTISFTLNDSLKNIDFKLIPNLTELDIEISSEIIFNAKQLDSSLFKWLIFISSFININYIKKQRMRISVWNVPYIISTYRIENENIYLPKGLLNEILLKFKEHGIKYKLKSKTISGKKIEITNNFELNDIQKSYFYKLIKNDTGVLIAPTGFGKTMIGLNLIKHFSKTTLIIVDRKIIAEHWKSMIIKYTNFSEKEIDLNQQKKNKIMIRTYQSINDDSKLDQFKDVGLTIVDECHHTAAYKYENVIKKLKSKYLYGLTATLKRYDNLEKIVNFLFGNVVEIDSNSIEIKSKKILKIIPTNFSILHSKNKNISEIHKYLIQDKHRNALICKLLENLYKKNKKVLVFSEWVSHIENIYSEINKKVSNTIMLHGQMKSKNLKIELSKAEIDIPKIILATGKFLGEGYDLKSIDTIVNIFPFSFEGKLKQYMGRIRENGKNVIFAFDFFDQYIYQYVNMFSKRINEYKKLGYELINKNEQESNQFIFSVNNFLENFKIDFNSSKQKIMIKTKKHHFFDEIIKLDVNKDIINKKPKNKAIKINATILDNRIAWCLSDDFIIRVDNKEFTNELIKYL